MLRVRPGPGRTRACAVRRGGAMKAGAIRSLVLTAACMLSMATCASASDFGDLLARADAVRSSDPSAFADIMGKLERAAPSASVAERRHLQLLKAYDSARRGDYGGQTHAGFHSAVPPAFDFPRLL